MRSRHTRSGRWTAWAATGTLMVVAAIVLTGGIMEISGAEELELHRMSRAPELSAADAWLNTEHPISINDLRGQVVLLDFWTYCCINCMHVFPELKYLEDKYADQPFVVIGVHSGKFDQEKDPQHIRQAILRHNIEHPVAVDSEFRIWNSYGVRAWPTLVLIDPSGYIVGAVSGEGHVEALDNAVAQLLEQGRQDGTLAQPIRFRTERDSFKSGVLEFPGKILADGQRALLAISDTNHHRVLLGDLEGKVHTVIGNGEIGLKDGDFASAQFHQPQGLALSPDGSTLYIADTENHAIRAVDLLAKQVKTIAGTGERSVARSPDGPAAKTALNSPWDLALVGDKLYIAMAGPHQIWVMDLSSQRITVFAGTGYEAAVDGSHKRAGFAQPSGLATDGKILYVADSEVSSIRTVELKPDGQTRTLAGSGELFGFGLRDGAIDDTLFQHPLGVALRSNELYVADTFNHVIRHIDLSTGKVTSWFGSGKTADSDDASDSLFEPGGISVTDQTLFIADTNHHRILTIDLETKQARALPIMLPDP